MPFTNEQQKAISTIADEKNTIVNACAGSGKTTTLKGCLPELSGRVLVCMYNKAAQQDFSRGLKQKNIHVKTTHALAYRDVVAPEPGFRNKLNGGRITKQLVKKTLGIETVDLFPDMSESEREKFGLEKGMDGFDLTGLVWKTAENFLRSSLSGINGSLVPLTLSERKSGKFGFCESLAVEYAKRLWERMTDPGNEFPITHDTYLKIWQLRKKLLEYDVVLVDEAQDTNPVMADIFERHVSNAGKIAYVGDTFQSIYAFRGATDALKNAEKTGRFEKLFLTQSFRFGEKVAEVANKILSHHSEKMPPIRGFEKYDTKIGKVEGYPITVLCRSNHGVFEEVVEALSNTQKVHVCVDVKSLVWLLEDAGKLKAGGRVTHPDLTAFRTWQALCEEAREMDDPELKRLIDLTEKGESGKLAKALESTKNVREQDAHVVISTAHKAKGREWERVRLADDFRSPFVRDENGEVVKTNEQELNLLYVAATRAQGILEPNEVLGGIIRGGGVNMA